MTDILDYLHCRKYTWGIF